MNRHYQASRELVNRQLRSTQRITRSTVDQGCGGGGTPFRTTGF